MRDHQPQALEVFNGLWARGNVEETPLDHFSECNNIQSYGQRGFQTRYGIGRHQSVVSPLSNVLRVYNYATTTQNTVLVLVSGGMIYHVVDATNVFGPILTIPTMTDFGFASYGGRAYITPFTTETAGTLNRERGIQNEFVYVYKGDGTAARKAAGAGPTGALTIGNGAAGGTDVGVHIFGVVYETDSGYLSAPGALTAYTTVAGFSVNFSNVPVSPNPAVTKRHIVASKVIPTYNGDVTGYQMYFIPGATIPNNVGTVLNNQSFFDSSLLEDASHLSDNFSDIPAGVGLGFYQNRMFLYATYANPSTIYLSSPGEPEAFNQVDGVLDIPQDGNYITNAAELRDVLYVFKRARTISYVDNGDEPATWALTAVDNAMGCGVHGIASVLDTSATNVDYLLIASYSGIILFNGRYILPELSFKVQELWRAQAFKTLNRYIQPVNDPVNQVLYIVLTDRSVLHADYSNGLEPKAIKWYPWSFDVKVNALCLINISELILGCDQV